MKRIIDKRRKEKFMIDDEYLNGQAKICGWQATLVYNSLCRHANIDQESFPSIELMMTELGIGRNTVIKGIKNLKKYNVIEVGKKRNKNGKWLNNSYTLIDKSEWTKNQVPLRDTVPSPSQNITKSLSEQNQVPLRDTKETHRRKHIEGNTSSLSASADGVTDLINQTIKKMKMKKDTNSFSSSDQKKKRSKIFNYEDYLGEMKNDKNRNIQIIRIFFLVKQRKYANLKQVEEAIRRNLKAAKSLAGYSDKQIDKTMEWLNTKFPDNEKRWTLETVGKYIDDLDDISKSKIVAY